MVRCRDIADKVGVSRQAVTAVLNNSRPNCVSKEKRDAILKIAKELHYQPNQAAVALKTGKSRLVGVVMPPWENPYIAELCMAIQRGLTENNYSPVFAIDNNFNPVPGNLRDLLSLNIAGLITVAASLLPNDVRVPVVSYFHKDPRFDAVSIDADQDSRLIMEHLKARGHRKIGFLGTFRLPRYESLVRTAEEYGLEFPERWHVNLDDLASPADSFDLLLERNKGLDLPTALILFNDDFAIPIMRRIHERGYKIPKDFSVIGHDDICFSADTVPALTTIRFGSPDEIASAMIRLLLKRIREPDRLREVTILKSVLIERESVANKR